MNYSDNPILSEAEYQILNSHYAHNKTKDRLTHANQINIQLQDCKNMCFNLTNVNAKIYKAINLTISEIDSIISNLEACLSIRTHCDSVTQFNLFKFINKLLSCGSRFLEWEQQEQKEYYKNFAMKSHNQITMCVEGLIKALENSNVKIYKYM